MVGRFHAGLAVGTFALPLLLAAGGCGPKTGDDLESAPTGWLAAAWVAEGRVASSDQDVLPDQIFLVHPDGSDYHALDLGAVSKPFGVSWSSDGKRLLFENRTMTNEPGKLWTVNVDGTAAEQFWDPATDCPYGATHPDWSPDGSAIALVCYRPQKPADTASISLLDVATKKLTDVVTYAYPETIDNPPAWSPDGKQLVFELIKWNAADTAVEESSINVVSATGGDAKTITGTPFAAHPDWSPTGDLIVFNNYDTGNLHGISEASNLFTIKPDGTGLRQLSTASTGGHMRLGQPFWSSDGTRVWVSVARDWERDSHNWFKNTLAWVDAKTGALHELKAEGKRWREQPR